MVHSVTRVDPSHPVLPASPAPRREPASRKEQTPRKEPALRKEREGGSLPRIAILLGLAGATLSAIGSWIPSLWGDEAASVLSAERSLPSLFRMLGHVDAVHGTYYLLLHFWIQCFGTSPFAVRFPSALAVGFAIAGIVLLGARLGGKRAGAIAGIVCVILPRTTYMGEEARGYALSAACVTWLTLLLVILLERRGEGARRSRLWWLYGAGVAICAYVFLFSLLILVAHGVIVLLMRNHALVLRWFRSVGIGIVLAAPVLVYGVGERGQIGFLSSRRAATFTSSTVTPWFGNVQFAVLAWGIVAATVIVAVVTWRKNRGALLRAATSPEHFRRVSPVVLGMVWLIAPAAILLTANVVQAVYSSRYLSFATPAAALVIGWFLSRLTQRRVAGLLLLALVATASGSYFAERTPYSKNDSDWAAQAAVISANARPGDAVLFDETARPSRRPRLAMRIYPRAFLGLQDVALRAPWWRTDGWDDTTYPLPSVLHRLEGVRTVWLLEYRPPGRAADSYDLPTLARAGFSVVRRFPGHSSEIVQLAHD